MPLFTNEVLTDPNFPLDVTGPLTDTELRATPVPISGTVTATPTGTQDVSVTSTVGLTDTQLRATPVPISGSVSTTPEVAVGSTVSVVNLPATTNTTLLSANTDRRAAILVIAKAGVYVKFGATASATSYTYKTPAASTVIETQIWTGQIDAFGPASEIAITELTI